MIFGSRLRLRLAGAADADIDDILDQTLRRFGTKQYEMYAALIEAALNLVADEPMRSGSKDQSDLIRDAELSRGLGGEAARRFRARPLLCS